MTQPLRHAADVRTLALMALGTASLGISWLWSAPLLPLSMALAVTACCAKHNHTHCPTFRGRRANRLMDYWLTFLTGSSTSGIRVAHQVRHHGASQSPEDFVRCSLVTDMSPGKSLLCYVPLVIRETWREMDADMALAKRCKLRAAVRNERIALWMIILPMLWLDAAGFLLWVCLPWIFGQWFLIAMNLPQHDGCDAASRWDHSRNIVGKWSNWWFLNNGFHTAHHERPGLHWSRLAERHAGEIAPRLDPQLSHRGLADFWRAWWKSRRRAAA